MNQSRTEVDSSRRSAWAFTRLRLIGYPQYLRMRRRSNLSTFFCVYPMIKYLLKTTTIMKKILLLLILMSSVLTSFAQYWEKIHKDADELKGSPAINIHLVKVPGVGAVTIHDSKEYLVFKVNKGIFDYRLYNTYYTVAEGIAGLYSENGELVEKVSIRTSVSEDSPSYAEAYFNTALGYEGSGAIRKIISWIRDSKGSVRFVFPKYGGSDFDIKVPTLVSNKQVSTKSRSKGTTQKRATKPQAKKK